MTRIFHILLVGAAIGGIGVSGCTNTPAPTPHASHKTPPSLHDPGLRSPSFHLTRPDTIDQTIDVLVDRLGEDVVVVRDPSGTIIKRFPFELVPGPIPNLQHFRSPHRANHPAYFGELSHATNASGYLRHAAFVERWDAVYVRPNPQRPTTQEFLREQFEETLRRIREREQNDGAPPPLITPESAPE